MSTNKNIFARAYDAILEARMRQAEFELSRYKEIFADKTVDRDL